MAKPLRVLVAGCGSIGRRHVKNLVKLGVKDFVLCDTTQAALERAAEGLKDPVLAIDFATAVDAGADAAVICTPASMHIDMCMKLAKKGVHLFIEKPLAHSLYGVMELGALARNKNIVAMMGMCHRFDPVFRHLKKLLDNKTLGPLFHVNYCGGRYLPDYKPDTDYRGRDAANENMGGGVVLTSIHVLDNLRWLFGEVSEAHSFVDKVSHMDIDVEDLALGIFRMKSGVYVSWQMDFLQRAEQHRMVIVGEKGTIRCDFIAGLFEIFIAEYGKWYTEKIPFETNTRYMEEMKYFLECIKGKRRPETGVEDGYKTLRLALDLKAKGTRPESSLIVCSTG